MLKIGIIGAGSIAKSHLNAYAVNSYAKVVAIADLNEALAKERAKENYLTESKPTMVSAASPFEGEVNHFVDCCRNNTPCICQGWQAIELMKIIEGIYKSVNASNYDVDSIAENLLIYTTPSFEAFTVKENKCPRP